MRWYSSPLAPQEEPQYLYRIQYGYDRMSRRLWRQDLAAPATTKQDRFYGYDGLGQVVDSTLGNLNINRNAISGIPSQREAFDYDPIGNRKDYLLQSDRLTTLDQKRTHNQDNQLIKLDADASGLSYAANGNMTACRPDKDGDWSKGYTLVWDAWSRADWREARQTERSEARRVRLPRGGSRINRIVLVRNAQNNTTVASYVYDGVTRRITTNGVRIEQVTRIAFGEIGKARRPNASNGNVVAK